MGEVPNIDMLAADLVCRIGTLPITYLSLPLGASYKQLDVWNPILERMQRRLAGWKVNYLSEGGRLTLFKATFANVPIHFMSLFNIPRSIALKIEKIQTDFLWKCGDSSFGMHLVAWDIVCFPKSKGGMGLHKIVVMNIALLCKWLWQLGMDED